MKRSRSRSKSRSKSSALPPTSHRDPSGRRVALLAPRRRSLRLTGGVHHDINPVHMQHAAAAIGILIQAVTLLLTQNEDAMHFVHSVAEDCVPGAALVLPALPPELVRDLLAWSLTQGEGQDEAGLLLAKTLTDLKDPLEVSTDAGEDEGLTGGALSRVQVFLASSLLSFLLLLLELVLLAWTFSNGVSRTKAFMDDARADCSLPVPEAIETRPELQTIKGTPYVLEWTTYQLSNDDMLVTDEALASWKGFEEDKLTIPLNKSFTITRRGKPTTLTAEYVRRVAQQASCKLFAALSREVHKASDGGLAAVGAFRLASEVVTQLQSISVYSLEGIAKSINFVSNRMRFDVQRLIEHSDTAAVSEPPSGSTGEGGGLLGAVVAFNTALASTLVTFVNSFSKDTTGSDARKVLKDDLSAKIEQIVIDGKPTSFYKPRSFLIRKSTTLGEAKESIDEATASALQYDLPGTEAITPKESIARVLRLAWNYSAASPKGMLYVWFKQQRESSTV